MCDHRNSKCMKTTGEFYFYRCFEPGCGHTWQFEKNIVKKLTLMQKIKSIFKK